MWEMHLTAHNSKILRTLYIIHAPSHPCSSSVSIFLDTGRCLQLLLYSQSQSYRRWQPHQPHYVRSGVRSVLMAQQPCSLLAPQIQQTACFRRSFPTTIFVSQTRSTSPTSKKHSRNYVSKHVNMYLLLLCFSFFQITGLFSAKFDSLELSKRSST